MYTLQCYLSDGIFFETKQVDVMNPLAYFVSLRIYSTHTHTLCSTAMGGQNRKIQLLLTKA